MTFHCGAQLFCAGTLHVLVTIFGSLSPLTLGDRHRARKAARGKKDNREIRATNEFNIGMFDEEKLELKEQKACLLDLEEEHKAHRAAALAAAEVRDAE